MKNHKLIYFSLTLMGVLFCSSALQAQNQAGAFSVAGSGYSTAIISDYQSLGVNPANLGWLDKNHMIHLGFGELDIAIYSEPLKRTVVDELFSSKVNFNQTDKEEAVRNFTDSKLQFETNINIFGVAFQHPKIGGFGFAVKERLMWDSNLNEESADILFKGYDSDYFIKEIDPETGDITGIAEEALRVTELFEGTQLELAWFREYNFGFGRQVFNTDLVKIYGGFSIKYLKGYSMFDYRYTNGVLSATSALNPLFEVEYDAESPSKINNNDYQPIGEGFGFDLGLSAMILNKLRVAVSVTDIGSITWDGNVYRGEDALLENIQTAGLNNYNIFDLDDNLAFDNLKWGGWDGLESKKVDLPMSIRSGAAFILNEKVEFGTEFYVPLNETPGAYDKLIFGIGSRLQPIKWFRGSIGIVSGGETGTNIPVGLTFLPINNESFAWEMGVAVRDITTYFGQDKPTVSLAMGVMRFSFGQTGTQTAIEKE